MGKLIGSLMIIGSIIGFIALPTEPLILPILAIVVGLIGLGLLIWG